MFFRVNTTELNRQRHVRVNLSPAEGDKAEMKQQTSNPNKRVKSWVLSINLQKPQVQNKRRFVHLNIQRLQRYKSIKGSKLSHWLCSNAANIHSPLFWEKWHTDAPFSREINISISAWQLCYSWTTLHHIYVITSSLNELKKKAE